MSLTVRDFRKHVDGKELEAEAHAPLAPMLPQEASDTSETGIPELDKLVRVIQANIEMAEEHLQMAAQAVVVQVNVEMRQKMTLEYMLAKGMLEAYRAIQKLPAQIIAESQPQHHA